MTPLLIPALDLALHLLVHGFELLAGKIEAVHQDSGDPCPQGAQDKQEQ